MTRHAHTWAPAWPSPICTGCGQPATASPSQVETYAGTTKDAFTLGCPQRWAYQRVLPRKQNDAAAFGDRVHQLREHWLREGRVPPQDTAEGKCASRGLDRLPLPGRALAVELAIKGLIGHLPHSIKIDVVSDSSVADMRVTDHKTIGNVRDAKTPDALRWDPQWLTYGRWAVDRGARRVQGTWEYLQRDGKADTQVEIVADAAEIVERSDALQRNVVLPMLQANTTPLEQHAKNPRRCDAYGRKYRCEFFDLCWGRTR